MKNVDLETGFVSPNALFVGYPEKFTVSYVAALFKLEAGQDVKVISSMGA